MSTSIETPLETKLQVRTCLTATYRRRGSWEAVADYYGMFSKAAYWRTVKEPGYLPPPGLMENVLAKGAAPRLQSIPIYPDENVDVYYRPGNGTLHTYTVPADAQIVIVPAGARVVQPKPTSQPARKRDRIEATRYTERGFTTTEIVEVVREVFDSGRIPPWLWNHPGMADVVERRAKLLHRRVEGWLAEDAGTDPVEVAAVLARIEQELKLVPVGY